MKSPQLSAVRSSLHRLSLSRLSLLLLGASSALACGGSDDLQEEVQAVEAFDTVIISDGFQASLATGSEYKVILLADGDAIDDIVFTQTGETIEVSYPSGAPDDAQLEIEVTLPSLASLTLKGGSQLSGSNIFLSDDVSVTVSDSSSLSLLSYNHNLEQDLPETIDSFDLTCEDSSSCEVTVLTDDLTVDASDASSVTVNGQGTDFELTVSDSSEVSASEFDTQDATVTMSNSSSGSITASGTVTGSLTDASTLKVSGGATVTVDTDGDSSVTNE